ncbi:MAG: hemerythrin [Betaproteobacteria bacterium]|jgi:hemerythrin-like metal-binding protein|nr:hemerythrin [Betaproteobacteria bacterium]HMV20160.1 hemerythrin domain-containing protein [Rhodocyclaceae bacterium]HMW76155.1 hemerythrin domain-containing protein [Rhodocyclaceae bacterium]HNE43150.1 hemerythrin domain-containing protein [Rhodocyclaceae bacterium]HNM22495.1 hemerythrin domain-containing protein [Rhodocyclaceae bacterium]
MDDVFPTLLPEALIVDVPELDAQHEAIFAQIEAIKKACLGTDELPLAALEMLIDLLRGHFASEEQLARESGIYFGDHDRVHRESLAALDRTIHRVRQGSLDGFCLLRYLECWFERHILDQDIPFAERLNAAHAIPRARTSLPSLHLSSL